MFEMVGGKVKVEPSEDSTEATVNGKDASTDSTNSTNELRLGYTMYLARKILVS